MKIGVCIMMTMGRKCTTDQVHIFIICTVYFYFHVCTEALNMKLKRICIFLLTNTTSIVINTRKILKHESSQLTFEYTCNN